MEDCIIFHFRLCDVSVTFDQSVECFQAASCGEPDSVCRGSSVSFYLAPTCEFTRREPHGMIRDVGTAASTSPKPPDVFYFHTASRPTHVGSSSGLFLFLSRGLGSNISGDLALWFDVNERGFGSMQNPPGIMFFSEQSPCKLIYSGTTRVSQTGFDIW